MSRQPPRVYLLDDAPTVEIDQHDYAHIRDIDPGVDIERVMSVRNLLLYIKRAQAAVDRWETDREGV